MFYRRYAFRLNNKFRMTIAMQFIVSTLVVCSNLYQMTKSSTVNASYLPLLLYMSCMLTQIFIYCWYGNKVKLKVRVIIVLYNHCFIYLLSNRKVIIMQINIINLFTKKKTNLKNWIILMRLFKNRALN